MTAAEIRLALSGEAAARLVRRLTAQRSWTEYRFDPFTYCIHVDPDRCERGTVEWVVGAIAWCRGTAADEIDELFFIALGSHTTGSKNGTGLTVDAGQAKQ